MSKRMAYIFDLRQAVIDHEEDLAVAIATDQAKHVSEARGEVRRIIEIIETACSVPISKTNVAGNDSSNPPPVAR